LGLYSFGAARVKNVLSFTCDHTSIVACCIHILLLYDNILLLLRDRGMSYIVGKDWRDLFDVVIVQADKPSFFNDRRK